MKRLLRKAHRWLGLLMAVQLLAWMSSGLYFSLFPIEEIRGEHLTRAPESPAPGTLPVHGGQDTFRHALDASLPPDWELSSFELVSRAGQPYWRAGGEAAGQPFRRLLTPSGELVPRLSAAEAEHAASDWLLLPAEPVGSQWVEPGEDPAFRDSGAAWRVSFEGEEAVDLYLDPWTGDLLARRTDRWRLFDFFWMLHIMDYGERENFNHPLLQAAAALGLLVAISGLVYWTLTRRPYRRRKSARPA
jgi:uncharacterized iron-regulated membrane protein